MPIAEEQISILIPTFRQPAMVRAAVLSALASGAGEILVSDDKSGDGTAAALADLTDPRLQVFVQEINLGLWPNHLWLIRKSTRPWIKILQHDDRIAPGGLAAMAAVADDAVAVVSAIPIFCDLDTGALSRVFELDQPLRFTSAEYMRRFLAVGNELGTPSMTLFRRSALDTNEAVWRREVSADLLINLMAASQGDVVLLPPGPMISGHHSSQDSNTQGLNLFAKRLRESLKYVATKNHAGLQAFVAVYGLAEAAGEVRMAVGQFARLRWPGTPYLIDSVATFFGSLRYLRPGLLPFVLRNLKWKYGHRVGRNIAVAPGAPSGRPVA